jgi:hypothetical protein
MGGALGPFLGGVFTEKVTVYFFHYFLTAVAMGVLDYGPRELFLPGPDILLPSA